MVKAGISRVAWKRYIMESGKTHEQEIPFLAIARSLGDYWSYNTFTDDFIVSPDPDVGVVEIDPSRFRYLGSSSHNYCFINVSSVVSYIYFIT